MAVVKVTSENYDEIKNSEKTVLLDFYADWCGPCKMVSPIVDQIAEEHPEYLVGKVNVDDEPELAEKYGIMSIPSIFVFKDGQVAEKKIGLTTKNDLLAMLK